jgi:hypothetical protein
VILQEGKDLLFCEQKRSKKTFIIWVCAGENACDPDLESFLLLFSKKKRFLLLA